MNHELSVKAKNTMSFAQKEAERLGQSSIGAEHIFLGLISTDKSIAEIIDVSMTDVLEKIQVSAPQFQTEVQELTEQAENILGIAWQAVMDYGGREIDNEHLLIGLIQDNRGKWGQLIQSFNIDMERILRQIKVPYGAKHSDLQHLPFRKRQLVQRKVIYPASAHPSNIKVPNEIMEGLTKQAQTAFRIAAQESAAYQQIQLHPDFIVLGLLEEDIGIASAAMKQVGLKASLLRRKFLAEYTTQHVAIPEIVKLSQESQYVIKIAQTEAGKRQQSKIGTAHLLLGLLSLTIGPFNALTVDRNLLHSTVLELLGENILSQQSNNATIMHTGEQYSLAAGERQKWLSMDALEILLKAESESKRLGHQTEVMTILLALCQQTGSAASIILDSINVNETALLKVDVENLLSVKPIKTDERLFSLPVVHLLEVAWKEASTFGTLVKPAHILLALIRISDGIGYRIMQATGANPESMIPKLLEYL